MSITINLSASSKAHIGKIIDPIKPRYLQHAMAQIENQWAHDYNTLIRDAAWPICTCFADWDQLPHWIQQECVTQHGFSPSIYRDSVRADAEKLFVIGDRITLDSTVPTVGVLRKHASVIKSKRIVDFACNDGRYSFWCHGAGAAEVTGVDARSENIEIANIIKQDLDPAAHTVEFRCADIHDLQHTKQLCQNRDTVLLLGIMYHVHDHYGILESVCQPHIGHVMIETEIHPDPAPVIAWTTEPTFELRSGWHLDRSQIMIGCPSLAWFDLTMEHFGWQRIDHVQYDPYLLSGRPHLQKTPQIRSVMVYQNPKIHEQRTAARAS